MHEESKESDHYDHSLVFLFFSPFAAKGNALSSPLLRTRGRRGRGEGRFPSLLRRWIATANHWRRIVRVDHALRSTLDCPALTFRLRRFGCSWRRRRSFYLARSLS